MSCAAWQMSTARIPSSVPREAVALGLEEVRKARQRFKSIAK